MDSSHDLSIRALIANVPEACLTPNKLELALERFVFVCNEYQERRQLLDTTMPAYIDVLLAHIDMPANNDAVVTRQADHAFQLLAFLCKVRHEKVMMNRLPHGVELLPPVLETLEHIIDRASLPSNNESSTTAALDDVTPIVSWQTPYVLLLWLTLLVGNPFDLQRFSTDDRSVIARVHRCATHYAHTKSRAAQVASRLLAQLMARSDTPASLLASTMGTSVRVIVECQPTIATLSTSETAATHIAVLAQLMKRGAMREKLIVGSRIPFIYVEWQPFTDEVHTAIAGLPLADCSTLIRKGVIKLEQRIALALLPPRACKWRYSRGGRTLLENVSKTTPVIAPVDDDDDDDDFDVPPLVEEIVGVLLSSMGDSDTVVRWSVAKGVGRVCARLPRQMADDVIGGVLEQMSDPSRDECGWHSACFALAELARRGCLLPRRLDAIVHVACEALQYALQRGRHALGSNVRDAGAYLCWALARAFTQTDLATHVQMIAAQLVVASLADRNVSVRRAAQSAFQELVGRHGRIAHSELLMEKCDYIAVNNTRRCYTQLMAIVWPLDEYRDVLLKHVLADQLHHWHASIRELSAESLASLTRLHPDVGRRLLCELVGDVASRDLFKRHGALLAVGNIVDALLSSNAISPDELAPIMQLPLDIYVNHAVLLAGSGAEPTRVAVYDMIAMLLRHRVPVDDDVFVKWHDMLLVDIGDVRERVRTSASRALGEQYGYSNPTNHSHHPVLNTWLPAHLEAVQSDRGTEAHRIGHIHVVERAASVIQWACPLLPAMHTAVAGVLLVHGKTDQRWAESRRGAVLALDRMNDAALANGHIGIPCPLDALLTLACRDYTHDERGDVGRIVREVAVTAVVNHLLRTSLSTESIAKALPVLVTIAVEPLDSVREKVVEGMRRLLATPHALETVPHYSALHAVFIGEDDANDARASEADVDAYLKYRKRLEAKPDTEDDDDEEDGEPALFVWRRADDAYERLAPLLAVDDLLVPALRGYVVAAGGLGESVQRAAIDQLTAHVQQLIDDGDVDKVDRFFTCLATIADENALSNERVYLPLLVTLDILLSMDALLTVADGRNVDDDIPWLSHIADNVAKMTLRKRSVRKVTLGVAVQCAMLQFDVASRLWTRAMQRVLTALAHVYPGVRRSTADKLYETLLLFGTLDNHNEVVATLLAQTQWHSDKLDEVRGVRDTIAERMNVVVAESPRLVDKSS